MLRHGLRLLVTFVIFTPDKIELDFEIPDGLVPNVTTDRDEDVMPTPGVMRVLMAAKKGKGKGKEKRSEKDESSDPLEEDGDEATLPRPSPDDIKEKAKEKIKEKIDEKMDEDEYEEDEYEENEEVGELDLLPPMEDMNYTFPPDIANGGPKIRPFDPS